MPRTEADSAEYDRLELGPLGSLTSRISPIALKCNSTLRRCPPCKHMLQAEARVDMAMVPLCGDLAALLSDLPEREVLLEATGLCAEMRQDDGYSLLQLELLSHGAEALAQVHAPVHDVREIVLFLSRENGSLSAQAPLLDGPADTHSVNFISALSYLDSLAALTLSVSSESQQGSFEHPAHAKRHHGSNDAVLQLFAVVTVVAVPMIQRVSGRLEALHHLEI